MQWKLGKSIATQAYHMRLEVVQLPEANKGLVLLRRPGAQRTRRGITTTRLVRT